MAATKALLAFGGITHCCFRCGLRMFFESPPDRAVAGAIDDVQFHDLVLRQPQCPACAALGGFGTSQGDQLGFLLAIALRRNHPTTHNTRRGIFHGVAELKAAIDEWIEYRNQDPKTFTWTATAKTILVKHCRAKKFSPKRNANECVRTLDRLVPWSPGWMQSEHARWFGRFSAAILGLAQPLFFGSARPQ
jgi:hypothetical protein